MQGKTLLLILTISSIAIHNFTDQAYAQIREFKITASDGAINDQFGLSVSISGDYAVIGAFFDDDNGNNSGSAYVFKRTDSIWTQEAKLLATDGTENDFFGNSISISENYVVMGAFQDE